MFDSCLLETPADANDVRVMKLLMHHCRVSTAAPENLGDLESKFPTQMLVRRTEVDTH